MDKEKLEFLKYAHSHSMRLIEHLDRKGTYILTINSLIFTFLLIYSKSVIIQFNLSFITSILFIFTSIVSCIGLFFSWRAERVKSRDKCLRILYFKHFCDKKWEDFKKILNCRSLTDFEENFIHDIFELSKRLRCKKWWLNFSIILFLYSLLFLLVSTILPILVLEFVEITLWGSILVMFVICLVLMIWMALHQSEKITKKEKSCLNSN